MKKTAKAIPSPWADEPRHRQRSRDDKRAAVLRAAAHEFSERGYAGASLDNIAAALGVSKPTIYYHVGDKEELFHACCSTAFGTFLELRDEFLKKDMSARDALRAFVKLYVEGTTDEFAHCLIVTELHVLGEHTRKKIEDQRDQGKAFLREILVLGQREGEFDPPSVDTAVSVIAGALSWIAVWYDEREHSKARIVERFIESFERMLLVKDRLPPS